MKTAPSVLIYSKHLTNNIICEAKLWLHKPFNGQIINIMITIVYYKADLNLDKTIGFKVNSE